ncbi:16061_t:CDS:1, partial [Acaulospora morrowiae]
LLRDHVSSYKVLLQSVSFLDLNELSADDSKRSKEIEVVNRIVKMLPMLDMNVTVCILKACLRHLAFFIGTTQRTMSSNASLEFIRMIFYQREKWNVFGLSVPNERSVYP